MNNIEDTEKQPLLGRRRRSEQELSLGELQRNAFQAQRQYMRAWSRTTSGKWHKRIMFSVTAMLFMFMLFCVGVIINESFFPSAGPYGPTRVPLEAHIMSKCPDARDCLHDMILPAMQNVSHKVDFKLSYIGNATDHDDRVECKHGQEECLGNIIELCAAYMYPDTQTYLGFTMCLTRNYEDIPDRDLIEDCALEHGMSVEKLNECTTTEDGSLSADILRASFKRSSAAGVTKSCTVRLNGKIRCVRDGGEWKDCDGGDTAEDLVADIEELYRRAHDDSS